MLAAMPEQPLRHCFPPVVRPDARLLILGSLPGARSLAAGQYYANPRNQFWRLLEPVLDHRLVPLPYRRRLSVLLDGGIGLWDMVAAGRRAGSLDANIRLEAASDLPGLVARLPRLRAIAFNGGTSARLGRRQIGGREGPVLVDLPSSSPAFTLPFETKRERWSALRRWL